MSSSKASGSWSFAWDCSGAPRNYNYKRYYQPGTGRYLGVDPVRELELYAYAANNTIRYVDVSGTELVEVNLSGLGKTYLDSKFKTKVDRFISEAKKRGVRLKFNSAYRSPAKQSKLRLDPNAITPARLSLHSCGYAVDINFVYLEDIENGLTGEQQRQKILEAAAAAGLKWGGKFKKPDKPHFYEDPGFDRKKKIEEAYKEFLELTGQDMGEDHDEE